MKVSPNIFGVNVAIRLRLPKNGITIVGVIMVFILAPNIRLTVIPVSHVSNDILQFHDLTNIQIKTQGNVLPLGKCLVSDSHQNNLRLLRHSGKVRLTNLGVWVTGKQKRFSQWCGSKEHYAVCHALTSTVQHQLYPRFRSLTIHVVLGRSAMLIKHGILWLLILLVCLLWPISVCQKRLP